MPQLFNVTLTYLRGPGLGPVTRSHLLAYEAGASIALEQIKGVPCSGPIILTAAACVEAADSRVNCDFPATRKTLSNPCHGGGGGGGGCCGGGGTTGCVERPVSRKENATHQLGYQ